MVTDAFKDSDTERKQLLLKLTSLSTTTVNLLKEFCLDFRFDQQECLMMYLEYLVLNWEPDMDVTVGATSDSKGSVNFRVISLQVSVSVLGEFLLKIRLGRSNEQGPDGF